MQAVTTTLSSVYSRCRLPGACLLAGLAFFCLWTGFGLAERLPLSRPAIADAAPGGGLPEALSSDRAALLQSSVDSLALGMSGVFASEPFSPAATDGPYRREALASALRVLTFNLGGEVYFTAWNGTRAVYSPLSPDAVDMDFAEALDADGTAFVQRMERLALEDGGFLRVKLARQFSPPPGHFSDDAAVVAPNGPPPVVRGGVADVEEDMAEALGSRPQACPLGRPDACGAGQLPPAGSGEAVEQVVYVKNIPGLNWHIAAFMPADVRPAEPGFSRVWSSQGRWKARLAAEELFRKGLCVSGFSLAGLAGLMLAPARRREKDGLVPQTGYWWEEFVEPGAADGRAAAPDTDADRAA